MVVQKFAGQVRKGEVIVAAEGEFVVEKVVAQFGGSWFDFFLRGVAEPVAVGQAEKVPVKA